MKKMQSIRMEEELIKDIRICINIANSKLPPGAVRITLTSLTAQMYKQFCLLTHKNDKV